LGLFRDLRVKADGAKSTSARGQAKPIGRSRVAAAGAASWRLAPGPGSVYLAAEPSCHGLPGGAYPAQRQFGGDGCLAEVNLGQGKLTRKSRNRPKPTKKNRPERFPY